MSRVEDQNGFTMESTEALINVARNPLLCSALEGMCPLQDTIADFQDTVPPFSRMRLLCLRNKLVVSEAQLPLPVLTDLMVDAQCLTPKGEQCGSFTALNKTINGVTPFFTKYRLD